MNCLTGIWNVAQSYVTGLVVKLPTDLSKKQVEHSHRAAHSIAKKTKVALLQYPRKCTDEAGEHMEKKPLGEHLSAALPTMPSSLLPFIEEYVLSLPVDLENAILKAFPLLDKDVRSCESGDNTALKVLINKVMRALEGSVRGKFLKDALVLCTFAATLQTFGKAKKAKEYGCKVIEVLKK